MSRPEFPHYAGLTYLDMAFSSAHLQRFHMCRTTRLQNLAEHSARVAYAFRVLLRNWSSAHGDVDRVQFDRMELLGLKLALDHDLVETLVSDVASHSKTPTMRAELKIVEGRVLEMVVDGEEYLAHILEEESSAEDPEYSTVKKLVKLADIAEGLVFSYYNQGLGHQSPDQKSNWVNNNWNRMAVSYIEGLDSEVFPAPFKEWARSFIVDQKLCVAAQHA